MYSDKSLPGQAVTRSPEILRAVLLAMATSVARQFLPPKITAIMFRPRPRTLEDGKPKLADYTSVNDCFGITPVAVYE